MLYNKTSLFARLFKLKSVINPVDIGCHVASVADVAINVFYDGAVPLTVTVPVEVLNLFAVTVFV